MTSSASPARVLGLVALVFLARPAASEVAVLTAGGGDAAGPPVAWSLDHGSASGTAAAPDHPLAPQVGVSPATRLEVRLAGGQRLAFTALGVFAEPPETGDVRVPGDGAMAVAVASLPPAFPSLETGASPGLLAVRDAWLGVDELFALRDRAVKHDVVLHEEALAALGSGDVRLAWAVDAPAGAKLEIVGRQAILRGEGGDFLARIPAPVVAEEGAHHPALGIARLELAGPDAAPVLSVVVSGAWLRAPGRAFPVHVDPTVSLQPASDVETGFVDETGFRQEGAMASGTLLEVDLGADARAYAEFDTSSIPDAATILDVRLLMWICNHQNDSDPVDCMDPLGQPVACPLDMEVKAVAARASDPDLVLHAAIPPIGGPGTYVFERVDGTGPEWCAEHYVFRDYDLGPQADSDLQGQLLADYFTIGVVSSVETDPLFDHIDEIGYPETVLASSLCLQDDLPGSRITLVVEYALPSPPTCDAGGPYVSPCPTDPIALDGRGSFDPDGDALTFSWTTSCSGSIAAADQAEATLTLGPGCGEDCAVTLTVSDGTFSVSCSAPVSAHDTLPPEVRVNGLDGLCLWPPRHDLYCLDDVAALVEAVDACQPNVAVRIAGCVSDQPDEAREPGRPENGDGHFADDCQVSADGRGLCVRVERAGNDPEGRHYGVALVVDDGCGNVVATGGRIFVPHDRRGGSGGQDDPCERGGKVK